MKFLICSLIALIIGCNSTTYECVEVYGEVGVIKDGCLVEPLADVQIEFSPAIEVDWRLIVEGTKAYRMVDGEFVFHDRQTTVSDSLGRWILSLNPGKYVVHFEKFEEPQTYGFSYTRRTYYASHVVTVPNQPKWRFTID